jgi:serine/threonine-protein kinase
MLDRAVALKIVRAGLQPVGGDLRFQREARAAARLQHPNIVSIFDVGSQDGQIFTVLEYVPGGSLADLLRADRKLPPRQAVQMTAMLARAVQVAHENGILHRDLKPGNVLMSRDGTPKITDFGLAKLIEDEQDRDSGSLTMVGQFVGTPSYMSPEQALGKPLGPQTDVYALGTMLYEMLAGRRPIDGRSTLQILANLATTPPTPLRELDPMIPAELDRIVLKTLEKDPGRRYSTAGQLADDLERWLSRRTPPSTPAAFDAAPPPSPPGHPATASPDGLWRRLWRRVTGGGR